MKDSVANESLKKWQLIDGEGQVNFHLGQSFVSLQKLFNFSEPKFFSITKLKA